MPGRAGPPGLEGRLPQTGGVRPQLTVTVDLDSLQGRTRLGGGIDTGALDAEGCRRLACDGAVTRVLVTRQPTSSPDAALDDPGGHPDPGGQARLTDWLRTAAARRLPPVLGGAPSQPLEVGRTTRVVQPGQRLALAARDGGCVFPCCDRPLSWCEAHHLWHWRHGGPTDLANLVLLCRAHHRAVHEAAGGWSASPTGG
jgi:HNH endonuclease